MQLLTDKEYKEWKKAFDKMVPHSFVAPRWSTVYSSKDYYETDTEQYGGVSMYIPRALNEYKSLNKDFTTMGWYTRVGWDGAGW